MRILILTKAYPPWIGGIEFHVRDLAEGLASRGIETTVLACSPSVHAKRIENGSLKIILAPRFGTVRSVPISPTVPFELSRLDADLIHIHHPYPLGFLSYLLVGQKKPLLITWHSDIVRQKILMKFFRPIQNAVLKRASRIIVTTERLADNSPHLSAYREKCVPIPLGIDLAEFDRRLNQAGSLVSPKPGSPPSQSNGILVSGKPGYGLPSILFVGRLVGYKGLEFLLRSMPEIQARLWVVGDGPLLAQSRALAESLNVANRVHFLGEISDEELALKYAGCAVFVLPSVSNNEAFGLVQLEAMAAGKPIVSTDLPTGVPYVNQHGVTGFVVPVRDSKALSESINAILTNPDLALRMGKAGRHRVEQEFQLDSTIERTIAVYREILR